VANEQKLVTLMSSSGRISYGSSNFLRFWHPNFIEETQILQSKDRLQGKMKTFSRDMTQILEANKEIFRELTMEILRKDGIIYEEDLFKQVFKDSSVEGRFAVHKFLFEACDDQWIKDGQWTLSGTSSGPYALRSQWQLELIFELEEALKNRSDLDHFKMRVKESLTKKEPLKIVSRFDELILKCLKTFSEEFYLNAISTKNPFKKMVTEAFLGVAIVDSQSEAKSILSKLENENELKFSTKSKPLINSFINERVEIKDGKVNNFNIINSHHDHHNIHDFGEMPVYLIDPIGTVEVDDGLSVETVGESVILHVHVADPSDLVTGKVEEEAKFKGETIYLPEIKIPMLPERITSMTTLKSRGIKTLTFSCKIDLETGHLTDHQIRRGIINNLKHFTYEEAEMIKDNPDLDLLKRIRDAHFKYRNLKGHLNFSFPRGLARLDFENQKILVKSEDDLLMKRVVAESMIIAGRIAGEYLKERKIFGPFRNHVCNIHGIGDIESKNLLEKYEILKGIQSASVDFVPKKHDSMGLEAYVKVTSPLRRYLDLVTHKILKQESINNSVYGKGWFENNLESIHRQELYNKRLATSVNRFWIEKFIWQQEGANRDQIWTLTPLEKFKEDLWMVHVHEVENNFLVAIKGGKFDLGEKFKSKIIGKSCETLLKFEVIK
jgi:hypothetical protein